MVNLNKILYFLKIEMRKSAIFSPELDFFIEKYAKMIYFVKILCKYAKCTIFMNFEVFYIEIRKSPISSSDFEFFIEKYVNLIYFL